MRLGNKKIYHLEAWVVKVMSLYKVGPHQALRYRQGIDVVRKIAILFGNRARRFRRSHLISPTACLSQTCHCTLVGIHCITFNPS